MATARITLPDGRVARVTGDEANIEDFISSIPNQSSQPETKAQETSTVKNQIPFLGSLGQELSQAQSDFYSKYPGFKESAEKQKLAKEVGGSIVTGAGTSSLLKQVGLKGTTLIPRVAREAISSAAGAQAFNYETGKDRAMATGLSAVAGPVLAETIPPVISGASNLAKFIGKLPGQLIDDVRLATRSKQIEEFIPQISQQIKASREASSIAKSQLKASLAQENINLGKQLQEAIRTGGREIQGKTIENLRKVSPKYGAKLTELISKAEGNVNVSDAVKIAQDALDEISARGFKNPKVEEALTQYIDSLSATKTSQIFDEFGRPIVSNLREPSEVIPIKELLNKRTSIMSNLSKAGAGRGEYSQADLAAIIFDRNMTNALSPKVEGLQALRGEYAQFKKLATELYKVVRPKSGEYNTKAIEGLIKRYTSGNASQGEIDLVKAIENGTELIPGAGKFYADADYSARLLHQFKSSKPEKLANFESQAKKTLNELLNKKEFGMAEKRELGRAWTRLKVAGSLIGTGGALGTIKAFKD